MSGAQAGLDFRSQFLPESIDMQDLRVSAPVLLSVRNICVDEPRYILGRYVIVVWMYRIPR